MVAATIGHYGSLVVGFFQYKGHTYYAYGIDKDSFCRCAQSVVKKDTGDEIDIEVTYNYYGDIVGLAEKCNIRNKEKSNNMICRGNKNLKKDEIKSEDKAEYFEEVVGNVLRIYKLIPVKSYEVKGVLL